VKFYGTFEVEKHIWIWPSWIIGGNNWQRWEMDGEEIRK
jgi:hypothetical protein